jgi:hypothetical protein
MLDVLNLSQDYVGAVSSGSRHAVVREAFADRCSEFKWKVLDNCVSEPDVDLGFIISLKRFHVQLLVILVQRDSQMGVVPEKEGSIVVGSLRVGCSNRVVKVGNGSLRRRGDRPQPTRISLGWSVTSDVRGEC